MPGSPAVVRRRNLNLAREYVTYKDHVERSAAQTVRRYRGTLDRFLRWLDDVPLCGVTQRKMQAWVATNRHRAPGTARTYHATVNSFFVWLQAQGHVASNPLAQIPKPPEPRRRPKGLDPDEVRALFMAVADLRERAILVVMLQQGLRSAELARLQVGDLDFLDGVMVVVGKGDKERTLPITDETERVLRRYLDGRKAGYVLENHRTPGTGLDPKTVGWIVRDLGRRAGVGAHAHLLRHTCAHDLLRAGVHIRDVQAILGHASIETTERYLPWSYGDLREAMEGRYYNEPLRAA